MRHCIPTLVLTLALALPSSIFAQQPAEKPVGSDVQEKIQVTLFQVDALAIDKNGKTVTDLKLADFEMKLGDDPLKVSHVDLTCPIGAVDDPVPLKNDATAPPPPIAPGVKRRVVFAFDYTFLSVTMRPQLLDAAQAMLRMSKTPDEEVMIVALTSEVRVEQGFTKDIRYLIGALERMKHDVTLWAREYGSGTTGRGYFGQDRDPDGRTRKLRRRQGRRPVFRSRGRRGSAAACLLRQRGGACGVDAQRDLPGQARSADDGAGDALVYLANKSGGRMPFSRQRHLAPLPARAARFVVSLHDRGLHESGRTGRSRRSSR